MNTTEFLRLVLPSRKWYYVAIPSQAGKGFKHHHCETVEELAAKCIAFDEQGENVYFALASYREVSIQRTKGERTYNVQRVQENVQHLRAFWLDLDVGTTEPGKAKKYASQVEAAESLGKFVSACGLPAPLLVSSGYGVHAYWPLTDDILPGQWKATAEALKDLTRGLSLLTDPTRTADSASVLRPVGTHNRKIKDNIPSAAPVVAFGTVTPSEYKDFDSRIRRAVREHGITPKKQTASDVNNQINEGASIERKYPPASAHRIADRCNQIRMFRDNGGDVAEPHWYAAIQLLNKTIESGDIIHQWSSPYPGYSKAETDRKIDQVKHMGPTLCTTFEARNPDGCANCPFRTSINTPIQLGVELKEAAPPVVIQETEDGEKQVELPPPPAPFKRGDGEQEGLYVEVEPGVPIQFYPYDLFPMALEYDESDHYETTRVRHRLPLEGWKEFRVQSSLVHAPREFNMAMADQSVKYTSEGKFKDTMRLYFNSYLKRLQEETRINYLHTSCGWKAAGTKFLLGKQMFCSDGTVHQAGLSHKVASALQGFGTHGDFNAWRELTRKLNEPGYEAHAFTLMIAFGAPLLHVMEVDGALFNMVAETGTGKSTMGRWMMSVYGDYNTAHSSNNSTINARIQKIGAYGNLPMYIDELSNITPEQLSNLAYDVAGGKGRERLRSDASMAEVVHWKTFILSSSNHNLHDILTLRKASPKAETMRIFEYPFPAAPGFYEFAEKVLHPTLNNNYGHAGEKYIQFLVQQDQFALRKTITQMKDHITKMCGGVGHERFWLFGAACTIVGGLIARGLGLIEFDPMRILPWIYQRISGMRGVAARNFSDEVQLLAQFLNEFQGDRLIVRNTKIGHTDTTQLVKAIASGAKLSQRLEQDTGKLYISRRSIREWLIKRSEDYNTVRTKLVERGILGDQYVRKMLGAGTQWSALRDVCWCIDLNSPQAEALLSEELDTPPEKPVE